MLDSIGRYEIKAELGRGGFGRVYRAWDPTVGRMVAIKTLASGGDPELLQRFRNEAAAAGKLRHRNIVVIHDFGEHDGEPYIVMELLEGEDLQKTMATHRTLSLLQKMQIMEQVAEGLDHAHRNGVVHRDVKPANMMLLPDGTVKLMDFGIALVAQAASARLTKTGIVPGTLKYMSPEQFRGSTNDPSSDIFSYGVVFYELLSGKHPFDGVGQPSIMYNILNADPAELTEVCAECPKALAQVILRCVQKDRDERYSSLDELLFDTRPIMADLRQDHARGMLSEAQRLADAGQQETAHALLREVLELDPSNRTARDLREQLQTFIRRKNIQPRIDELLNTGRQRMASREYIEAMQAFESALRLDRTSEDALALMAQARAGKHQSEEAAKLVAAARMALSGDDLTGAYQRVNEALQRDPHHPEAVRLVERVRESIAMREHELRYQEGINRAKANLLIESFDQAIRQLEQLQREYADHPEIAKLLGLARTAQEQHQRKEKIASELAASKELLKERQFDTAVSRLESLDREFPSTPEIYELLVCARDEWKAQKRQDTIERLMREVAMYQQSGNYDAAIQMLERGLNFFPDEPAIDKCLRSLREEQRARERQQALDQALLHGASLQAEGLFVEALRALDQFRGIYGAGEAGVEALRAAIEAENEQKKRADAVNTFTQEVEGLLARGQSGTAVKVAQKAVALYPGQALQELLLRAQEHLAAQQRAEAVGHLVSEAEVQIRAHKFDRAFALIEQGLQSYPGEIELQRLQSLAAAAKIAFERSEAARIALAKARALLGEGKAGEAVAACEAVLRQYEGTDYAERAELLEEMARAEAQVRERQQREEAIAGLLERARELYEKEDFAAGMSVLEKGLRRHPNESRVLVALNEGKARREVQERRGIITAINEAMAAGRLADAERLIAAALARYPEDGELKGLRQQYSRMLQAAAIEDLLKDATARAGANDLEEAFTRLEHGLRTYPAEPALQALLSQLRERKKQQDRETALRKAAEEAEDLLLFEEFESALARLDRAEEAYGSDERIATLRQRTIARREIVREQAELFRLRETIAALVREAQSLTAGKKYSEALEVLDEGLKRHPGEPDLALARHAVEQAAEDHIAKGISEECLRAEQQYAQELFDEAMRTVAAAVREFGDDSKLAELRGRIEEARRKKREAEVSRAAAIGVLAEQASRLNAQNQHDEALALIEKSLNSYPGDSTLLRLRESVSTARDEFVRQQAYAAAVNNARAHLSRGHLEEGIEATEEALRQYPDDVGLTRLLHGARQALERRRAEEAARIKRKEDLAALGALLESAPGATGKKQRREIGDKAAALARQYSGDEEVAALLEAIQASLAPPPGPPSVRHQAEAQAPPPFVQPPVEPPPVKRLPWAWIAAGVALVASATGYFATRHGGTPPANRPAVAANAPAVTPSGRNPPGVEPPKAEPPKKIPAPPKIEPVPPPPKTVEQGTLVVSTTPGGADVYLDGRRVGVTDGSGSLRLPLEAKAYSIRVEKPGYQPAPPLRVSIGKNVNNPVAFRLNAMDATLSLRGATAAAVVRLDSRQIGTVGGDGSFTATVTPGEHTVELRKDQYQPRSLNRRFEPGQPVILEGNEVSLTEIPKVAAQPNLTQELETLVTNRDPVKLEEFAARNSASPLARLALAQAQDLRWNKLDKRNVAALREYAGKYPASPYAKTAQDTALGLEWDALDKNNAKALQAFQSNHPGTEYAARAGRELEAIDQRTRAAAAAASAGNANASAALAQQNDILQALGRYSAAFSKKDVDGIVAVYPSADAKLLRASFAEVRSITLTLQAVAVPELSGNSAIVTCDKSTTLVARNGRTSAPATSRVRVRLNKSEHGWLIQSIQ